MRRLWKEELLEEIFKSRCGPLPNSATFAKPGGKRSAPSRVQTFVLLHSLTPMRQLLRLNNSVQKQTIARILELHY